MRTVFIAVFAASTAIAANAEPSVERGEYLVRGPAGCGNCHTPQTPTGPDMSNEMGGFMVEKNPAFEAWAVNITPGSRVANWSDTELAKAIREGIRPDGSVIGPPMPISLYRGLSDDDLYSIVAFLRTVPASQNKTPFSTLPKNRTVRGFVSLTCTFIQFVRIQHITDERYLGSIDVQRSYNVN